MLIFFSSDDYSALHKTWNGNYTGGEIKAGFEVVKSINMRSKQDGNLFNMEEVSFYSSAHNKILFYTDKIMVHMIHIMRNTEKL